MKAHSISTEGLPKTMHCVKNAQFLLTSKLLVLPFDCPLLFLAVLSCFFPGEFAILRNE